MSEKPYHDLADMHRPKTPAEIERSARELAGRGFSDYTVAAILKLDVNALRQMLGHRAA